MATKDEKSSFVAIFSDNNLSKYSPFEFSNICSKNQQAKLKWAILR